MIPEPSPEPGTIAPDLSADSWSRTEDARPADTKTHRAVVELRNISRTYGSDPPVQALRGVDLAIHAGDWLAVVGPSGSGKSTLLNILGCLDRPSDGTYLIDGIDASGLTDDERASLRARSVGFVFQTFHLLGHRTALENVMLAEVYSGGERSGRRERALAALKRVGMQHRSEFLPIKLSGGEQQRVAIARALLGSPSLLLCDEPTGNLDSVNTASVMSLFGDLARDGLTLVVITHDENVAAHARRAVRIVDGRLSEQSV
jgi:ABC-type lipoprotein export system ATPase subunit